MATLDCLSAKIGTLPPSQERIALDEAARGEISRADSAAAGPSNLPVGTVPPKG